MKTNLLTFIILIAVFSCSSINKKDNGNNKDSNPSSDSIIIFNPFDKNITDLSADISNIIGDKSLELNKLIVPINKVSFDSLYAKEDEKTIIKEEIENSINTKYSRVLFNDNISSGDDLRKYKIIGYNQTWDSYLVRMELYINSVFLIVENKKFKVTKIKGEKPYISNDGKLFLSYYAIEEGLGYVYQIFKNDSGNISNISNYWSSASLIPKRFVWDNNILYIEFNDYENNSSFYKLEYNF